MFFNCVVGKSVTVTERLNSERKPEHPLKDNAHKDNNVNNKRSKLIIWDDHQKKPLSELKFNQNIMNVKLRKDKIIVVCRDKIYVFNLSTFKNMDIIETGDNSHGIVGVSYDPEQTLLAYPDKKKGQVK